jgi:hypothetical protein
LLNIAVAVFSVVSRELTAGFLQRGDGVPVLCLVAKDTNERKV